MSQFGPIPCGAPEGDVPLSPRTPPPTGRRAPRLVLREHSPGEKDADPEPSIQPAVKTALLDRMPPSSIRSVASHGTHAPNGVPHSTVVSVGDATLLRSVGVTGVLGSTARWCGIVAGNEDTRVPVNGVKRIRTGIPGVLPLSCFSVNRFLPYASPGFRARQRIVPRQRATLLAPLPLTHGMKEPGRTSASISLDRIPRRRVRGRHRAGEAIQPKSRHREPNARPSRGTLPLYQSREFVE